MDVSITNSSALAVIPFPPIAFKVGIGPDKSVPVKPVPATIAVRSPAET